MLLREDIIPGSFEVDSQLDESTQKRKWFLSGVSLQGNIKNANERIYPKEILESAINKYIEIFMPNRAVGELNHPKEGGASINPENISHKFINIEENGNDFYTKSEVLNTTKGLIVQNLLEAGIQLGISSRGFGQLKKSNDANIVTKLRIVTPGDYVFDPSAPDAFLDAVYEQKDWVYENGILVGKDLSEEMDKYKAILKESKEMTAKAIQAMMSDYFKKILG